MEAVMPEQEFNRLAALIARGYSDDQQRERYRAETQRREKLAEAEREQMRIEREKRREEQNRMQNERNPPRASPEGAEEDGEKWQGFLRDDRFHLLMKHHGGRPAYFAIQKVGGGPLMTFTQKIGPMGNLRLAIKAMEAETKTT